MKRILSSIIACCIISSAFSQIPNAGFESWSATGFPAYQNPAGWGNLNGSTWLGGIGALTCERGSGADVHTGSYSMKLTSKSILGLGDAPGITTTGTINTSTQALEGGFTYTQRPTYLKGWYKFSPQPGDSGEIRINLWKRNAGVREEIGEGVIHPTTAVGSFTQFLVPITYTSANTPDSGRILLVSTNTNNIQIGSVLIVDDLEFIDCSSFSVSVSTTDATIVGGADGSATANTTGGTGTLNYYWTPSQQATQTIVNLGAGSQCVTVTDGNGCSATACGSIGEPSCVGFSVSVSTTDATTTGGSDGSATANVTGGTGPNFTYLWDNASTTNSITNLSKGIYCVTVTDNVGCTFDTCGTVSDPGCAGFSISVTGNDPSTVGGSDGDVTATPTGGTPAYNYSWDTTATTGLSAGTYCVTVTDNAGCVQSGCVTLNDPDCSGFSVSVTATDAGDVPDGTASADAIAGTTPYSYLWNTGDTSKNLTGLDGGNYCVTATDGYGCTASDCDSVNVIGGIIHLSEAGINLFPNPVQEKVTIELTKADDYRFRLFDVNGKVVIEKALSSKSNVISLSKIPSGNYFVELKSLADGKMFSGKVVKE